MINHCLLAPLECVALNVAKSLQSERNTRNKVLYNKYLHDANDIDMCSATSLAELISVCDVVVVSGMQL